MPMSDSKWLASRAQVLHTPAACAGSRCETGPWRFIILRRSPPFFFAGKFPLAALSRQLKFATLQCDAFCFSGYNVCGCNKRPPIRGLTHETQRNRRVPDCGPACLPRQVDVQRNARAGGNRALLSFHRTNSPFTCDTSTPKVFLSMKSCTLARSVSANAAERYTWQLEP
jgi:hypothetical protein